MSLVRQMQEALRGEGLDEANHERLIEQLQARVKRLRRLDKQFGAVGLSRHVTQLTCAGGVTA